VSPFSSAPNVTDRSPGKKNHSGLPCPGLTVPSFHHFQGRQLIGSGQGLAPTLTLTIAVTDLVVRAGNGGRWEWRPGTAKTRRICINLGTTCDKSAVCNTVIQNKSHVSNTIV